MPEKPKLSPAGQELANAVGARIKRLRLAQGLRQQDMPGKCGDKLDQGTWSRLENGNQGFTPDSLAAVAQALGKPIYELFGGLGPIAELPSVESIKLAWLWDRLDDKAKKAVNDLVLNLMPPMKQVHHPQQQRRKA